MNSGRSLVPGLPVIGSAGVYRRSWPPSVPRHGAESLPAGDGKGGRRHRRLGGTGQACYSSPYAAGCPGNRTVSNKVLDQIGVILDNSESSCGIRPARPGVVGIPAGRAAGSSIFDIDPGRVLYQVNSRILISLDHIPEDLLHFIPGNDAGRHFILIRTTG